MYFCHSLTTKITTDSYSFNNIIIIIIFVVLNHKSIQNVKQYPFYFTNTLYNYFYNNKINIFIFVFHQTYNLSDVVNKLIF